jgi:hypothetical protein
MLVRKVQRGKKNINTKANSDANFKTSLVSSAGLSFRLTMSYDLGEEDEGEEKWIQLKYLINQC